MEQMIEEYSIVGEYSMYLALAIGLIIVFLARNQLKVLFFGNGYRNELTDASFSEHENRDIIYANEKITILSGVNIKTVGAYLLMGVFALLNPLISLFIYVAYKIKLIKNGLKNIQDFKLFNIKDGGDKFINFLNEKSGKINFLINEILMSTYLLLIAGLVFKNVYIIAIGLAILISLTLSLAVLFINLYSYKMNYKYIEYYQLLRLIFNSNLNVAKWDLVVLGAISWGASLVGFGVYATFFWIVFGLRFALSWYSSNLIKREDNISKRHEEIENREYTVIEDVASYPNPKSQSRGYKFTSLLQMKFFELDKKENGKALFHIDNYAFYPQTVNRTELRKNPLLKETLENMVKVSFEALDLTKQLMILGGMGSGKTEMINYIIEQVHNDNFNKIKSIAFNDIKGDFSKKYFRADKDILVNLYDKRAKVWCPFTEMNFNIESGTAFISNLFESIAGDDKDFFTASAKMKTATWLQESYFATSSNIEAWELFFSKITAYEIDIKERDDKTQSSILATIQIALEILTIMYYQIVVEAREIFTFNDFVNATDTQLFLVNNKQYEAKLTPYLTGLTATYINTIMAKEDNKEHLILNVFDEFLTMKIDEATRKTLLTATRSKGFCNVLMAQYLINDEKLIQDLDSSRYALITFNINDDFTLEKVAKKIADAEMLQANSSPHNKGEGNNGGTPAVNGIAGLNVLGGFVRGNGAFQNSYSLGNSKIVVEQQLQSMPKYHHLTFIPSEEVKAISKEEKNRFFRLMAFGYEKLMTNIAKKNDFLENESGILYLGYTPQATLSYDNASFEKWDMKEYYTFKSEKENKDKENNFDEKTIFKHWLKLKFSETNEEVEQYIIDNNLVNLDIDNIFEAVEEKAEKVLELISKHTEIERYKLMDKFFDIPLDDLDAKYEFCKEYDLIGGILGIFTFSDEFRTMLLNGEIKING